MLKKNFGKHFDVSNDFADTADNFKLLLLLWAQEKCLFLCVDIAALIPYFLNTIIWCAHVSISSFWYLFYCV